MRDYNRKGGLRMLGYLNWLKDNTSIKMFKEILEDVTVDIKFNNINFGKRTSQKEFIEICKRTHKIHLRCDHLIRS